MKRPTLATIARTAQVSLPVVYTVLKDRRGTSIGVGEKTRERILRIAKECDYTPSKSSLMLRTGRSNTIGVLIHLIIPPFSEILTHIQRSARDVGLDVIPYITDNSPALEEHYLNLMRDGRVDGIIPMARTEGSYERYRKYSRPPYHLPILYWGEPIPGVPGVHFDEYQAGCLAAQHLLETGCRRFAFVGQNPTFPRAKGFMEFLRNKGEHPVMVTRRITGWDYYRESRQAVMEELFKMRPLPDGIFATNDLYGVTILTGAQERGIRVPDDMAVIGCDNTEFAECSSPRLTSIDLNVPQLAQLLVRRIKEMAHGERQDDVHESVPVRLVVRQSTRREP